MRLAIILVCLVGCGDSQPADAGDRPGTVNDVDDLTKETTYCGFVGKRPCGSFCIPKENSTCCQHYLEDGGLSTTTWFPGDAGCY